MTFPTQNPTGSGQPFGDPASEWMGKPSTPPKRSSGTRNILEWIAIICIALTAAWALKTNIIEAFYIPSESMENTLLKGDRVLVSKLSYRMHPIHRGDVIVFTRPPKEALGPNNIEDLIKRVIGLPGEEVKSINGQVYINNKPINEPYIKPGAQTKDFSTVKIPKGEIWVMGDNRSNSSDSTVFGPIKEKTVVGRAFVIMWPPLRMKFL